MGVIQNAINQMLGSATIAAKLSPKLQQKFKMEQANKAAAQKAENKLEQRAKYRSFKRALYADPNIAPLGQKAKQAIYEQTKGDKKFKEEVINKYYGNK